MQHCDIQPDFQRGVSVFLQLLIGSQGIFLIAGIPGRFRLTNICGRQLSGQRVVISIGELFNALIQEIDFLRKHGVSDILTDRCCQTVRACKLVVAVRRADCLTGGIQRIRQVSLFSQKLALNDLIGTALFGVRDSFRHPCKDLIRARIIAQLNQGGHLTLIIAQDIRRVSYRFLVHRRSRFIAFQLVVGLRCHVVQVCHALSAVIFQLTRLRRFHCIDALLILSLPIEKDCLFHICFQLVIVNRDSLLQVLLRLIKAHFIGGRPAFPHEGVISGVPFHADSLYAKQDSQSS